MISSQKQRTLSQALSMLRARNVTPPAQARRAISALLGTSGTLAASIGLTWAGLHIQPAPFPAIGQPSAPPETIDLPAGLPAPVECYYRQTYGQHVPVIRTAVLSGRGTIRIFGITFPMRFRFIHEAKRTFRAYFELMVFGLPVIAVNEHYVNNTFRQEKLGSVEQGEPKLDHSANVRMWAEWSTWLPAMLLTDSQVRWEPIDDTTALLAVPFGAAEDHLIVRFDPANNTVQYIEGMKYKHAADMTKTLWINAVWFGDRPWASFKIEDMVYNAAVDTSLTARGP